MVFQRSDLEILLQQIVASGALDQIGPVDAPTASASAAPESVGVASEKEQKLVEALRDAILATNDLDVINGWLAEDIDALPTDEAASAALAWDLERVIVAARKIDAAAAEATATRSSNGEHAPLLLNAARAELKAANGDDSLRPFGNWAELLASLKPTDRVIELIARYGTHEALLAAATLADKRAVATLLVLGAKDTNRNGVLDESEVAPADRLDFLHATGAYAGGSLGGLNLVEVKVAGINAATLPVGADFVFESELETLQGAGSADGPSSSDVGNAPRVAAVSNGSSVILTGEGAGDDPGDGDDAATSGPAVDARQQFVRVGLDGRAVDDFAVSLRSGADGAQDLLIVGTAEADSLTGGAGNDTISGEAGNDKLSGGSGNDKISGGAGNDVVTGGDGNDQLQGGDGNDVIINGGGSDAADGGAGDDFLLADAEDTTTGGDGDDWVEGGGVASGDSGSDVIVASSHGNGQYQGGRGFDWISRYQGHDSEAGESKPDHDGVEGLSGTGGDDHIQGDDRDSDQIADDGGALTDITLVSGLQAYLDESLGTSGASVFDGGNIILGGGGNDTIQGGGGDDIIDGDLTLEVRILVDANANGVEDADEDSVSSLADLEEGIRDGSIDVEHLQIIREILTAGDDDDIDTAVFSGRLAEYEIMIDGRVTTVTHRLLDDSGAYIANSFGADGVDRVTRIERLQFSDQMLIQTRVDGETYVWQVPAALAIAIAEAVEDSSSNSGSSSSCDDDGCSGEEAGLLGQLAAAAADEDLGWLFDEDHGDTFDFSSLSAGDLGLATDTAVLDGSSGAGSLDLSGIDWLLGSDGDMFVFASGGSGTDVIDPGQLPVIEDVAVISLGAIDDSYVGFEVEIVGVHDIMSADYAV